MKNLILIFSILLLQSNFLITNNVVGIYKLGGKYPESYDRTTFDITPNEENKIISIVVKSDKYKTKSGFGVGSKVSDIKKFYSEKIQSRNPELSKGDVAIGNLGLFLTIDNISFIDGDENGIVDMVLVSEK